MTNCYLGRHVEEDGGAFSQTAHNLSTGVGHKLPHRKRPGEMGWLRALFIHLFDFLLFFVFSKKSDALSVRCGGKRKEERGCG